MAQGGRKQSISGPQTKTLYGDIKDRQKIIKAIESRKDISIMRKDLDHWDL